MSHNQFQFIGNLTDAPELKITASGKPVVTLVVAVNDSYKDEAGAKIEKVNYFRITAWGKLGENAAEFLEKGSSIFVQGGINNNNYEQDGKKVYGFEFVADTIQYLSKKKGAQD